MYVATQVVAMNSTETGYETGDVDELEPCPAHEMRYGRPSHRCAACRGELTL